MDEADRMCGHAMAALADEGETEQALAQGGGGSGSGDGKRKPRPAPRRNEFQRQQHAAKLIYLSGVVDER